MSTPSYNPSPYHDPFLAPDYRDSLSAAARVHGGNADRVTALEAKAAKDFDDAAGVAAARAKEAREAGNRTAVLAQSHRKAQTDAAGAPTMDRTGVPRRGAKVHTSGEILAARYFNGS